MVDNGGHQIQYNDLLRDTTVLNMVKTVLQIAKHFSIWNFRRCKDNNLSVYSPNKLPVTCFMGFKRPFTNNY
jgi:hypothetical protein